MHNPVELGSAEAIQMSSFTGQQNTGRQKSWHPVGPTEGEGGFRTLRAR